MPEVIEKEITISSRVRLARNFDGFAFPFKLNIDGSNEIINRTRKTFSKKLDNIKFNYIDMGLLDPINKQMLVERHLISPELFQSKRPCGLILSEDESVGIMVNEEDHLRIQCIFPGLELAAAMGLCLKVESFLENENNFAFDHRLGYLTTCPTNIGTGMRASVMLHLPALTMTGTINEVIRACVRLGLTARGLYGENSDAVGNYYQISNQKTLGLSEEAILNNVQNIVLQIIEQEKSIRNELYHKNPHRFEDRVLRAFGILKNARVIGSDESLRLLSDVRLGVDLGIVQNVTRETLDYLIETIMPGSLQKSAGEIIEPEQRDVYRAAVIRNKLENSK